MYKMLIGTAVLVGGFCLLLAGGPPPAEASDCRTAFLSENSYLCEFTREDGAPVPNACTSFSLRLTDLEGKFFWVFSDSTFECTCQKAGGPVSALPKFNQAKEFLCGNYGTVGPGRGDAAIGKFVGKKVVKGQYYSLVFHTALAFECHQDPSCP